MTSTAEDGSAATTTVEPSGRDDGRYAVRVQAPGPGLYRVELVARQGDKELARRVSHLRREDGLRERFAAFQHRALLERIAKDTGGRYWQLSDLEHCRRRSATLGQAWWNDRPSIFGISRWCS